MQRPGQALGDVDTKGTWSCQPSVDPLILKGDIVPSLLLSKVLYQLLSLSEFRSRLLSCHQWVRSSTSFREAFSLLSVIRSTTAVSSVNVMMMKVATNSCVQREYIRVLKTQHWGAPVLRMSVEKVCPATLNTWVLPIRTSKIHMRSEALELCDEPGGNYVVKCRTAVNEQ